MREKNNDTGFRHFLFILFMNKYTITSLIFLVWLTFFDRNNLVEKMQLRSKIATLKKEKAFCLILSALALPVLVFLALWTGAGLEGASLCLCVTAVPVLLGLPGGPEGEKR